LVEMLIFMLPIEKRLVVSCRTFFKFLGNQEKLERTENTNFFVDAGVGAGGTFIKRDHPSPMRKKEKI